MHLRLSSRPHGSALIIVLGFVVLLTVLVVAFLSKSLVLRQIFYARAGQTQVDITADSSMEYMKADLRQEIVSGSLTGSLYTTNTVSIYIPTANTTSVPSRTGFTIGTAGSDPLDNLVKVSRSGVAFFSGTGYNTTFPSPNFASASSTGAPALNGRYIDNATKGWTTTGWDKPQLIDAAKYPSALKDAPIPDWIYLTSTGRKVITSPDAAVVGRYAYVVYDEGGLLDINTAGYPSSLAATDSARKGPLALADLTQIPGGTTGITSAMQDAIVDWRNKASKSAGFSKAYPSAGAPDYLQYVFNGSLNRGFLSIYPGDQKFLSRQELLAYAAAFPATLPSQSLAYLSTFSRTLNAPTWTPTNIPAYTGHSTFDYAAQAEGASGTSWPYNVDSVNTRWPADVTIKRPKLDEDVEATATTLTSETVVFHKGEPVLQHRFPLGKLALLSNPLAQTVWTSPTPPNQIAWAVYYYFGLQWVLTDGTLAEPHWEYVCATPGATRATGNYIRSLPEVAGWDVANPTYAREPNFFEILRQGILKGSAHELMLLDIGASIIDQFDSDDKPTAISNGPMYPTSTVSAYRLAFGKENLPYFSQMLLWPYRPVSDSAQIRFEAYLIPTFWNPHRNASTPSTTITNLQAILSSGSTTVQAKINGPSLSYLTSPGLTSPATLPFATSSTSTYQEPTILLGGTGAPADGAGITEPAIPAKKRSGFFLGSIDAPDARIAVIKGGTATGKQNLTKTTLTASPTLTMQCQYPDGTWHTYESIGVSTGTAGANTWQALDSAGVGGATAVPSFSNVSGNNARDYLSAQSSGPIDPRVSSGLALGGSGGLGHTALMEASIGTGTGASWRPTASVTQAGALGLATIASNDFGYYQKTSSTSIPYAPATYNLDVALWSENNPALTSAAAFYLDYASIATGVQGDWVLRPGDGTYGAFPMAKDRIQDRPIILNRPFRSVAELGYAYRAVEWRTLDFTSSVSGDAGLLDLFSVGENQVLTPVSTTTNTSSALAAGVLNINTRHPEILQALLSGTLKNDLDNTVTSVISPGQTQAIAQAIVAETSSTATGKGPLPNRADLVTRIMNLSTVTSQLVGTTSKPEREAVVRALAESADTRTWNLLIDLVVQAGRYPPSSIQAGTAAALAQFDVQGERHYWLHLALDRYTGKVIDQQIEGIHGN